MSLAYFPVDLLLLASPYFRIVPSSGRDHDYMSPVQFQCFMKEPGGRTQELAENRVEVEA